MTIRGWLERSEKSICSLKENDGANYLKCQAKQFEVKAICD